MAKDGTLYRWKLPAKGKDLEQYIFLTQVYRYCLGRPRHSTFRKNLRIDNHDVGHGHEGSQARKELAADGGLILVRMKDALKHAEFSPSPAMLCCASGSLHQRERLPIRFFPLAAGAGEKK